MTERVLIFVCGIVVGILIALFLSEDAEAINRDQLPAMHQVAVDHFGPVPCGEVAYTFVPAATLLGDDAPLGVLARGGNCGTQLSAEYFDAASWGEACKTVVHEYGHSVRDDWNPVAPDVQDHSPDRNSIMYPDDTNHRFAPCERADPTFELEQRYSLALLRRYRASNKTITARRTLRRLVRWDAPPRKIARAERQVRVRRHAYEVARFEHRALAAELRAYGVDV